MLVVFFVVLSLTDNSFPWLFIIRLCCSYKSVFVFLFIFFSVEMRKKEEEEEAKWERAKEKKLNVYIIPMCVYCMGMRCVYAYAAWLLRMYFPFNVACILYKKKLNENKKKTHIKQFGMIIIVYKSSVF